MLVTFAALRNMVGHVTFLKATSIFIHSFLFSLSLFVYPCMNSFIYSCGTENQGFAHVRQVSYHSVRSLFLLSVLRQGLIKLPGTRYKAQVGLERSSPSCVSLPSN